MTCLLCGISLMSMMPALWPLSTDVGLEVVIGSVTSLSLLIYFGRSVGWFAGHRSVIISKQDGKLLFHAPTGALSISNLAFLQPIILIYSLRIGLRETCKLITDRPTGRSDGVMHREVILMISFYCL